MIEMYELCQLTNYHCLHSIWYSLTWRHPTTFHIQDQHEEKKTKPSEYDYEKHPRR